MVGNTFRRLSLLDDRSVTRGHDRPMSFDDAEEARLDEDAQYWFEESSLEQLERHMLKHFGTTDIKEMPEGRVKRAIVMCRFNRLYEASMMLTENCEKDPTQWQKFAQHSPIPEVEMGRGLER